MTLHKNFLNNIEIIHTPKDISYKKVLICIPGGGKTIGASRFKELQKQLFNENIGSVSINFAGVEGSLGSVEADNLENRITTTINIINWVQDNFTRKEISLYGVSMGGYVILGALQKTNSIEKIILHTPAAYAKESKKLTLMNNLQTYSELQIVGKIQSLLIGYKISINLFYISHILKMKLFQKKF